MEPQDSDAVLLRPRPFRKILTLSRSAGHEYVGGLLSAPAMLRVASLFLFRFFVFFLRLALADPLGPTVALQDPKQGRPTVALQEPKQGRRVKV